MALDREDSSDLSPPPEDTEEQPESSSTPKKRKRTAKDTEDIPPNPKKKKKQDQGQVAIPESTGDRAKGSSTKAGKGKKEEIKVDSKEIEVGNAQTVTSAKVKRSRKEIAPAEDQTKSETNDTVPKTNNRQTRKPQIKKEDNPDEAQGVEDESVSKTKRSRKTKGSTTDNVDPEDAPPTPKRKRKTAEEKAAEAMPLAPRTANHLYNIGAHVSASGGVHNAISNAVHIGANSLALFLKSQRKWANPALKSEHTDLFRSACVTHQYDASKHALPHGSYLVNLAHSDSSRKTQAYECFLDDLQRCETLGIRLYNFHPGNTAGAPRAEAIANLAAQLNAAHAATNTVTLLLETMAASSTSNTLGGYGFADLRDTIALVEDKSRIGVCLDTCHVFAAGHDLRSAEAFAEMMREFDSVVGAQYIKALHLNDSKAPLGSNRDLHANIGTGFLGLRAFHNIMNHKPFEGLPMVLETPIEVPNPKAQVEGVKSEEVQPENSPKKGKKPTKTGKAATSTPSKSEEAEDPETPSAAEKATNPAKAAKTPPKTVEDKNMWAREIKLLESLVGMDVDSPEFQTSEAELAEKGQESRAKHMEQFERKAAETEKKAERASKKAQKVRSNGKGKAKQVEDSESELSELEDGMNESEEEEKPESPELPA